jgi:hypothetical protein
VAHGVEPQLRGGRVSIEAALVPADPSGGGPRLRVTVADDGPGPAAAAADGTGLVTAGPAWRWPMVPPRFTLVAAPAGGAVAVIELPFEPEAPATAPEPRPGPRPERP